MSDLISRQVAIRWVKTECNPYGKPSLDFESGKKFLEHLEQMPSAQKERKTGKWELRTYMPHHNYCTCCDADSPYNKRWKYCPNCGADMRGGQHETN